MCIVVIIMVSFSLLQREVGETSMRAILHMLA